MLRQRSERNRKRPGAGGRRIKCPEHGCYIESASQKHRLFAETVDQLQAHGLGRRQASLALLNTSAVTLEDVWLEAFWCSECQESLWYHVRKVERDYILTVCNAQVWRQSTGTADPTRGNPSVSEFSQRQAKHAMHKVLCRD